MAHTLSGMIKHNGAHYPAFTNVAMPVFCEFVNKIHTFLLAKTDVLEPFLIQSLTYQDKLPFLVIDGFYWHELALCP